jgi:hypothetical protein
MYLRDVDNFGKINGGVITPMLNETFRALCVKVADETDPRKIEVLKQRMRLLLLQEGSKPLRLLDPSTFSNANN